MAYTDQSYALRRCRTFKTISSFTAKFSQGMRASVLGPTMVSMEILLDTDTKSISSTFTGMGVGYLVGAIACGILYGRMNSELLIVLSLIGAGLAIAWAPFSHNLTVFVAANTLHGLFSGIIDTACQPYLLAVWDGRKHKQPVMQGMYAMWLVGATVGPLVVRPFLMDIPAINTELPWNSSTDNNNTYMPYINSSDVINYRNILPYSLMSEISLVRFAFVVVALVTLISTILFLITFFMTTPSILGGSARNKDMKNASDEITKPVTQTGRIINIFVALIAMIHVLFLGLETLSGGLMATFVIKGLGWTNEDGSLVSAVYWGGSILGGLLAVPQSTIMSPRHILMGDFTALTMGVILLFISDLHFSIMWLSAGTLGLGIGSILPSSVLWAEQYLEITGAASSVFVASMAFGMMTIPALTGFLMDQFTHMYFTYVWAVGIAMYIATYVGAVLYVRWTGIKRTQVNISLDPIPNHNILVTRC